MTQNYQAAVGEARTLVKRSEDDQWRLAELTWEQVQAGKSRAQWARDIGVHPTATGRWHKIWERWGNVDHDLRPSWAEAWDWALGRDEGRDEHGSQYANQAQTAIRNLPPERRADVARELVQDPEVADAIIADPEAQEVVLKAYNRSTQSQQFRKDQDRHAKEQEARQADVKHALGGPRVMAALLGVDATFTMDGYARTPEGIEVARLSAEWLRTIATRLDAWADGITEPLSDDDFAAGIEEIMRANS